MVLLWRGFPAIGSAGQRVNRGRDRGAVPGCRGWLRRRLQCWQPGRRRGIDRISLGPGRTGGCRWFSARSAGLETGRVHHWGARSLIAERRRAPPGSPACGRRHEARDWRGGRRRRGWGRAPMPPAPVESWPIPGGVAPVPPPGSWSAPHRGEASSSGRHLHLSASRRDLAGCDLPALTKFPAGQAAGKLG